MRKAPALWTLAVLAASLAPASCGSSSSGASSASSSGSSSGASRPADPAITVDLQGRPYTIKAPAGLDPKNPVPLLVMLHGFTTDPSKTIDPGEDMDKYMGMSAETEKRGIVLAIPKGTYDTTLRAWSWNGTDACCGWDTMANDIGYLAAMIEEVEKKYPIDPKRVFVLGHSNGGFMANRLACDLADRFAGVVSLAGETYLDQTKCAASAPIAFLQAQGDKDTTVPFDGGPPLGILSLPNAPGAKETAKDWAVKNRCAAGDPTKTGTLDLDASLPGDETETFAYAGCEGNGATELWVLHGAPHSPDFNGNWAKAAVDFLMSHPRP